MRELLIEADGGSRGNPGVAGSGTLVVDLASGEVLAEFATYVGHASNNVAEYTGLKVGVAAALKLGADTIHVRMDSKLVVEQMSGHWKIKHPNMAKLAAEIKTALGSTPITFEWVPRAKNKRADALANKAMDDKATTSNWYTN